VNLKNMSIALIIALAYEVLLKLGYLLLPSLVDVSTVSGITSILSYIVGVTIILFVFFFYKEERSNTRIKMIVKILMGCIVLQFMFRLPITRAMSDYQVVRLAGEMVGFIRAILLFVLLIFYRRDIPSGEKLIRQAAVFVAVMFGIGVFQSLLSLVAFVRFVISGITVYYSPFFYRIMFALFLMTHVSIIYFLYRYYQFKFTAKPIDEFY